MRYGAKLMEGKLVSRPNRFLGKVKVGRGRKPKECFIPNPGRMEELLYPGATVFVKEGSDTERKTKLDLVLTAGYDYYPNATLSGHDTAYSPDGDNVNPREDYTYGDADQAIEQPKGVVRLMFGVNFRY